MIREEAIARAKILTALIGLQEVSIILDTFINAFRTKSFKKADGKIYLHGNFNIPGTVSGRMSSSKPNLQNIPSTGTSYAKVIKDCVMPPPGKLFAGADFDSLEDKISALSTKDPNKLKVYIEGYDGHSLRAYSYFPEEMPDIDPSSVESICSIGEKYPTWRQKSKGPTFALTYGGTHYALENQCGLAPADAIRIEESYHELYKVSDQWVADKIDRAMHDGYVTVAFGLRVRTPVLKQVLLGKRSTPYAAKSEARTAGNALGQSYGMLNNRVGIEMQHRVFNSQYRVDILPVCQIHDASYYLITNELDVIEWFNLNLVQCMEWQELPEIQHDLVKLSGGVDIFYPSWAWPMGIPNGAYQDDLLKAAKLHRTFLKKRGNWKEVSDE